MVLGIFDLINNLSLFIFYLWHLLDKKVEIEDVFNLLINEYFERVEDVLFVEVPIWNKCRIHKLVDELLDDIAV